MKPPAGASRTSSLRIRSPKLCKRVTDFFSCSTYRSFRTKTVWYCGRTCCCPLGLNALVGGAKRTSRLSLPHLGQLAATLVFLLATLTSARRYWYLSYFWPMNFNAPLGYGEPVVPRKQGVINCWMCNCTIEHCRIYMNLHESKRSRSTLRASGGAFGRERINRFQ